MRKAGVLSILFVVALRAIAVIAEASGKPEGRFSPAASPCVGTGDRIVSQDGAPKHVPAMHRTAIDTRKQTH
jgi:hypothetical protein